MEAGLACKLTNSLQEFLDGFLYVIHPVISSRESRRTVRSWKSNWIHHQGTFSFFVQHRMNPESKNLNPHIGSPEKLKLQVEEILNRNEKKTKTWMSRKWRKVLMGEPKSTLATIKSIETPHRSHHQANRNLHYRHHQAEMFVFLLYQTTLIAWITSSLFVFSEKHTHLTETLFAGRVWATGDHFYED